MTEEKRSGMGFAGVATIIVVLGYIAFELYGLHRAHERMQPAQVFAQFVRAQRAAGACDAEIADRADFDRNFAAVTRLRARDLAAGHSALTPAQVDERLAGERQTYESEVDALIAQQGCDGDNVWRLRKLYEARSRLKLRY